MRDPPAQRADPFAGETAGHHGPDNRTRREPLRHIGLSQDHDAMGGLFGQVSALPGIQRPGGVEAQQTHVGPAGLLEREVVGHIPVLRDGHPVGFVSVRGVLKFLTKHLG